MLSFFHAEQVTYSKFWVAPECCQLCYEYLSQARKIRSNHWNWHLLFWESLQSKEATEDEGTAAFSVWQSGEWQAMEAGSPLLEGEQGEPDTIKHTNTHIPHVATLWNNSHRKAATCKTKSTAATKNTRCHINLEQKWLHHYNFLIWVQSWAQGLNDLGEQANHNTTHIARHVYSQA